MTTGRVYVRFGKDYNAYQTFENFDTLIQAVAFSVKYANGKTLVLNDAGNMVACLNATKKYIATEATRLINRIKRVNQGDHMALHVSKRQINRLIRVGNHTGNNLSCYSLIVLHIIFVSIDEERRASLRKDMKDLEQLIYILANEFLRYNNHSDLAQYIVDCHPPVDREITGQGNCHVGDFPDIHRRF